MAKINQLNVHTLAGATAEALSATDLFVYSVLLIAEITNTGIMYAGNSAVATTSGIPLDGVAGGSGKNSATMKAPVLEDDATPTQERLNLADVYLIGTSGDKCRVIYTTVIDPL